MGATCIQLQLLDSAFLMVVFSTQLGQPPFRLSLKGIKAVASVDENLLLPTVPSLAFYHPIYLAFQNVIPE